MSAWQTDQANAALPDQPQRGVGLVTQLSLLANASLWQHSTLLQRSHTQRCCNAATLNAAATQPLDFFACCCSRLASPNDPHASVTNHLCHLRVKAEREAEEEGASLKRR